MSSNITIDGQSWDLAPPLMIGFQSRYSDPHWLTEDYWRDWHGVSARDFWAGTFATPSTTVFMSNGSYTMYQPRIYMHNEILLDEASIIDTGRCIADEAYSWGFSSLLLLTFCCYTIAFTLALIVLQTDVYWNSRYDRDHQSHSIYTDVLYLAEELKNAFGQNVEDHTRSPKAFDRKVGNWRQGLRLDVRELPLSRWQEVAAERANWEANLAKAKIAREAYLAKTEIARANAGPFGLELRILEPRNCEGSARDGAESRLQVVSRSDYRTTAEEPAPSLADVQTPTEGSVHDGMSLEDPVAESSLLGGDISGGAVHEGWVSRDRLLRMS
jgi:hypothetical protein